MKHPFTPDAASMLVLRAALAEPSAGAAAWRQWLATGTGVDAAPHYILRLLPLVHHNLSAHDPNLPERGRLAGLFRHTWYSNQLLLRAAVPALVAMRERGIEALLFKGAAHIAAAPAYTGARAMWDVDVLVRPEDRDQAARTLFDHGYEGRLPPVEFHHAVQLLNGTHQIDLHWRPTHGACGAGPLWDAVRRATLQGTEVMIPCPEDRILLTAMHAMSPFCTTLDWIGDIVLCARGVEVDWSRLVRRAEAPQAGFALGPALRVAQATGAIAVPPAVLAQLDAQGTRAQRALHALTTARWGSPWVAGYLTQLGVYIEEADAPSPSGYLRLLADRVQVDGRRGLARHWARRAAERTHQRLSSRPS